MLGFGFNKDKVRAAAERSVQQGKFQNAVSEYEKILKHDPKDLGVLNTVGDLYARLGQIEQAIACFKRVGDSYAAEGFVPKAIAMYKKLTKISPSALDCVQKLAELYTQQGLYSDARGQFLVAAEGFLRDNKHSEAVKILHRVLELDPDNTTVQTKLADIYFKLRKPEEGKKILLSAADSLHARGNFQVADDVLARLLNADPQNTRAMQMRGQIALERGDAATAAKILEHIPDLDSRPDALQSLASAMFAANRVPDAEPIARKLATVHNDLNAILLYGEKLLAVDPVRALLILEEFGDRLLGVSAAEFVNTLRGAVARVKEDLPSLELLLKLFERAGESSQRSEVSELIAHACVHGGNFQRAADIYKELAQLEPENPLHTQNYRQMMVKLGADPTLLGAPLNNLERPFALEEEPEAAPTASAPPAPAQTIVSAVPDGFWTAPAESVTEFSFDELSQGAAPTVEVQEYAPSSDRGTHEFVVSPGQHQESAAEPAVEVPEVPVADVAAASQETLAEAEGLEAEIDLSDEWASAVRPVSQEAETTTASDAVADVLEEARFYVANGMWKEAVLAADKLAELSSQHPELAQLRSQIAATAAAPIPIAVPDAKPAGATLDDFVLDLESSLGDDFDVAAPAKPVPQEAPRVAAAAAAQSAPLAVAPPVQAVAPPPPEPESPSMLDDLFAEFKEDLGDADEQAEDPDTHYNLGVAFKEMGLLDEAIGELQKVCQAIDRGAAFAQTMQVYTWLAHCFVEKGVPEASFKWFQRALQFAADDETRAAIHYELASAYETAGMKNEALRSFMEVYTTNIDFRDVGERIRALKS